MGNLMQKSPGTVQVPPQGGTYPQQPGMQPRPQFAPQQPQFAPQRPQFAPQQPQFVPQQPQFVPQQPQFAPQQPQFVPQQPQFAPQQFQYPQQPQFAPQPFYQPPFPGGNIMPHYGDQSSLSLPTANNRSSFENNTYLSNLTGWSPDDIERLRHEFLSYANINGVIDRDGFRKLYIASLLNMTWESVERDAEGAFRNFDINQTGSLDFNEYITACSRLARDVNHGLPMNSSYSY